MEVIENHMEVNIRHYVILALGHNTFLHPAIDEYYEKRKWDYYKSFKESGFYNDLLIQRYTLKGEMYMRKVAGIIEWCYIHNDFDILNKLIKKGYKFPYQYVEQRKQIDLEEFVTTLVKRKGGINRVSELDVFFNSIILVFLCTKNRKRIDVNNSYGIQFIQGIESMQSECYLYQQKQQETSNYTEEIQSLYNKLGISKPSNIDSVGKFFDSIIIQEESTLSKLFMFDSYSDLRDEVYKAGLTKYIGALSSWVKTMGFEPMDITESNILTKKDLDLMMFECLGVKEGNNIYDEEQGFFLITCLYIWAFANLYKEAKHLYLDDTQEQAYVNIKEKEQILKEKEIFMQKTIDNSKQQLEQADKKLQALQEQHAKLEKDYQNLVQEKERLSSHEKEVFALREFIYKQENSNEDFEGLSPNFEAMCEEISGLRIAVFGGHPNWQNKVKEFLPNVQFIDVNNLNINISFIDNMNHVFINTAHFNHTFYDKLMNRLNKIDTAFSYINGTTNIKKTVEELYVSLYRSK